jgi:site-specific recombinase XerD
MNDLTVKTRNDIRELAAELATYPAPESWTPAQKAQAVNFAALLNTAQKMITAANIAEIDYNAEKQIFIKTVGKTKSVHTRMAYTAGLERLENWTASQGISILELSPMEADNFIYALNGRAAASIRLDIAAASSFFTWLHRRHNAIDNPFRGSKARPIKKAVKKIEIPTVAEIKTIIKELPKYEGAAASIMAYRGLRAGALPTLSINGGRFTAQSKGKDITGNIPAQVLNALKKADLPLRGAFSGLSANTLEKRVYRAICKLFKAGKIKAAYSCHDLRHFFAVTEYKIDRDIHRVSKLLGHASIQVTEHYLRGLGELD